MNQGRHLQHLTQALLPTEPFIWKKQLSISICVILPYLTGVFFFFFFKGFHPETSLHAPWGRAGVTPAVHCSSASESKTQTEPSDFSGFALAKAESPLKQQCPFLQYNKCYRNLSNILLLPH